MGLPAQQDGDELNRMAREALVEKLGIEHYETLAMLAFRCECDVVSIAGVRIAYDRSAFPPLSCSPKVTSFAKHSSYNLMLLSMPAR